MMALLGIDEVGRGFNFIKNYFGRIGFKLPLRVKIIK
jgi:hypothetical protein